MVKPNYPVNVKVPQKYISIIDRNMEEHKLLHKLGFQSRAHFVRTAVAEKLKALELLAK